MRTRFISRLVYGRFGLLEGIYITHIYEFKILLKLQIMNFKIEVWFKKLSGLQDHICSKIKIFRLILEVISMKNNCAFIISKRKDSRTGKNKNIG